MTTEPLITDMDHFFAEQWQQLADDIERQTPHLVDLLENARRKAEFYRERIMTEDGR